MTHSHPGAGLERSVPNVPLEMTFRRLNNAPAMWRNKYCVLLYGHTETQMAVPFQGKTHLHDYTKRREQPDLSQAKLQSKVGF